MGEAIKQKLVSFEDILDDQSYILSDSDPKLKVNDDWYSECIYEPDDFLKLDMGSLVYMIDCVAALEEWFLNPKVHPTANVVMEIERFRGILHDKLKTLNEFDRRRSKKWRKYECPDSDDAIKQKKELFGDICYGYVDLARIAKKQVFKPGDPKLFGALEKMVVEVAAASGAKKDFNINYRKKYTYYDDLHSDEQLVAAALYLSMFERQRNCIVTPDSDIKRILSNSCKHIKNASWAGYVVDSLDENPVQVYFSLHFRNDDKQLKLSFDTSELDKKPAVVSVPEEEGVTECMEGDKAGIAKPDY